MPLQHKSTVVNAMPAVFRQCSQSLMRTRKSSKQAPRQLGSPKRATVLPSIAEPYTGNLQHKLGQRQDKRLLKEG